MSWGKAVVILLDLLSRIARWIEGERMKRLGKLEQENAQLKVDRNVSDAVDRADPDRVPDDIFDDPAPGSGDNVQGPAKG